MFDLKKLDALGPEDAAKVREVVEAVRDWDHPTSTRWIAITNRLSAAIRALDAEPVRQRWVSGKIYNGPGWFAERTGNGGEFAHFYGPDAEREAREYVKRNEQEP